MHNLEHYNTQQWFLDIFKFHTPVFVFFLKLGEWLNIGPF